MGNSYDYRSGDDSRGVLDAFTAGFVSALLFGERFDTSDDAEDDRSMLDHGLAWSDIAPESQAVILAECGAFQLRHGADILEYGEAEAGADLYFSAADHGCGFWEEDHGTPEGCARMDRTAKGLAGKIGSAYLGDDGRVYVSSC